MPGPSGQDAAYIFLANVGAPLQHNHRTRLTAADEHALVHAWQTHRHPRDAARLLTAFGGWLAFLARKRTAANPSLSDDALQEGRIAFLGALQNGPFEPGWRISVQAMIPVRKTMQKVVLRNAGMVDFLGKNARNTRIHIHLSRSENQARQEFARDGKPFSAFDITQRAAAILGVSVDHIDTYRTLMYGGISKDAPLFEDSEATFEPTCTAPLPSVTIGKALDRASVHAVLKGLLPSLHPVERTIVEQRILQSPPTNRLVLAKALKMGPDRYTAVETHVLAAVAASVQQALGMPTTPTAPPTRVTTSGQLHKARRRRMAPA